VGNGKYGNDLSRCSAYLATSRSTGSNKNGIQIVEEQSISISKQSGSFVEGDVNINGGDFVARDKVINITNQYNQVSDSLASHVPRKLSEAEAEYFIIDTASLVDYHVTQLEKNLGASLFITPVRIGTTEEIPDGGETRMYQVNQYQININFDKLGIAKGVQVISGLTERAYSLEHWPLVLSKMGIAVTQQPDIVAPAARRWTKYLGYSIAVFADKPAGNIWSVRIYKISNR